MSKDEPSLAVAAVPRQCPLQLGWDTSYSPEHLRGKLTERLISTAVHQPRCVRGFRGKWWPYRRYRPRAARGRRLARQECRIGVGRPLAARRRAVDGVVQDDLVHPDLQCPELSQRPVSAKTSRIRAPRGLTGTLPITSGQGRARPCHGDRFAPSPQRLLCRPTRPGCRGSRRGRAHRWRGCRSLARRVEQSQPDVVRHGAFGEVAGDDAAGFEVGGTAFGHLQVVDPGQLGARSGSPGHRSAATHRDRIRLSAPS
jgi:hypothetical protein